jgi:hypothetical protein
MECVKQRVDGTECGQLGLPTVALPPEQAEAHFGPLATWVANDGPASSAWTLQVLGWMPREAGLVADIGQPDYSRPVQN